MKNAKTNEEAQIEIVLEQWKRQAKIQAIQSAACNKPHSYGQQYGTQQIAPIHYDLIAEAEKIYQWLIKI